MIGHKALLFIPLCYFLSKKVCVRELIQLSLLLPQDASAAIPKGTLLSIIVTYISYMGMLLLSASVCVRDASGNATQARPPGA